MNEIIHLKEEKEFDQAIAAGVCIVDFFATWCGPCKMFAPTLDKIAEANPTLKVIKVDVDQAEKLADRYAIEIVPTVIVFSEGRQVERLSGLISFSAMQELAARYIK